MNSLQEELRQLTIGNGGGCNDGYVRTGTVAALVDNLQKNEEKNETYSRSKTAPWIPPKPSKKPNEMPQVKRNASYLHFNNVCCDYID